MVGDQPSVVGRQEERRDAEPGGSRAMLCNLQAAAPGDTNNNGAAAGPAHAATSATAQSSMDDDDSYALPTIYR